jgi:hypothetical protein
MDPICRFKHELVVLSGGVGCTLTFTQPPEIEKSNGSWDSGRSVTPGDTSRKTILLSSKTRMATSSALSRGPSKGNSADLPSLLRFIPSSPNQGLQPTPDRFRDFSRFDVTVAARRG